MTKCMCGHSMRLVFTWDNAQLGPVDHAYNLYVCADCGRVMKDDVWTNPGKRWLELDGRWLMAVDL